MACGTEGEAEDFAVSQGRLGLDICESRPCRKERDKDGAPSIVLVIERARTKGSTPAELTASFGEFRAKIRSGPGLRSETWGTRIRDDAEDGRWCGKWFVLRGGCDNGAGKP